LTGLGGGQTVGYTEVGSDSLTWQSDHESCRGWQSDHPLWRLDHEGGLSALSIFRRNKILSIFFVASVVTQNTLSFSRIMRALSNSREGDYSQYFQGDEYSQYLIVVQ
jgi:hypothetical protein